jgi:hypothetical protein
MLLEHMTYVCVRRGRTASIVYKRGRKSFELSSNFAAIRKSPLTETERERMNGNYQARYNAKSAFNSGNGQVRMTELHQHILSEKQTPNGGTRFVVRAVQFEDTKALYVALSRQWYKSDTKEWLPTQRGHIFLPVDVWTAFADNADLINEEFAQVLANGRGGLGRISNGAAEPAASGRAVQSDADSESDDGSPKLVIDDAVTSRVAAVTESEPPRRRGGKVGRKAQAKASYAPADYTDGPSTSKRAFYGH